MLHAASIPSLNIARSAASEQAPCGGAMTRFDRHPGAAFQRGDPPLCLRYHGHGLGVAAQATELARDMIVAVHEQ